MTAVEVHGFRAPVERREVHGFRAPQPLPRCTGRGAPQCPPNLHGFRAPEVHPRGCNIGIPSLLGIPDPTDALACTLAQTPCRRFRTGSLEVVTKPRTNRPRARNERCAA